MVMGEKKLVSVLAQTEEKNMLLKLSTMRQVSHKRPVEGGGHTLSLLHALVIFGDVVLYVLLTNLPFTVNHFCSRDRGGSSWMFCKEMSQKVESLRSAVKRSLKHRRKVHRGGKKPRSLSGHKTVKGRDFRMVIAERRSNLAKIQAG